ncbi:MAG: helix-turn-helix transcriptional regulator [Candidatus Obscuribacter sp.]|nr:helix-turn-helix transcriptional regulator [Candidatus Obscuribacter sp.]
MISTLQQLGILVKVHREHNKLTQEKLAEECNTNRSAVSHLEQGLRLPSPQTLKNICNHLNIPEKQWQRFAEHGSEIVFAFESCLSELTGRAVNLGHLDPINTSVAFSKVLNLFEHGGTDSQIFDYVNALLVIYDVHPTMSWHFFQRYFGAKAFVSVDAFAQAITRYQADAIRIFNSFSAAYDRLNQLSSIDNVLSVLSKREDTPYTSRTEWSEVEVIPNEDLPNLGYIAAKEEKQRRRDRQIFVDFLRDLAEKVKSDGAGALEKITEKRKRQMDVYRRQFESRLPHGFLSPLFVPDSDQLMREADLLSPKDDKAIENIESTQEKGLRNLSRYLSADHIDVYVATSMRTDADFVCVNDFVNQLFEQKELRRLKLRYFNPTQSWIEDRVAKGLVEALMLRRADYTIYMAQKSDSFGKDSEASVALGQGKAVIVYVPRLYIPEADVNSAELASLSNERLAEMVKREVRGEDIEFDDEPDHSDLLTRIITSRLDQCSDAALIAAASRHWADFGLYDEGARIPSDSQRAEFRSWLDAVIKKGQTVPIPPDLRTHFVKMLVALATRFEGRASIFKNTHPLALQVIIKSGVLNGMIVVRSVDSCATVLSSLILNDLNLELHKDEHNYRLVEKTTNSTIRVISRHPLISSAFSTYYAQSKLEIQE